MYNGLEFQPRPHRGPFSLQEPRSIHSVETISGNGATPIPRNACSSRWNLPELLVLSMAAIAATAIGSRALHLIVSSRSAPGAGNGPGTASKVPPASHCRIRPMSLDVPNPPSICLCFRAPGPGCTKVGQVGHLDIDSYRGIEDEHGWYQGGWYCRAFCDEVATS